MVMVLVMSGSAIPAGKKAMDVFGFKGVDRNNDGHLTKKEVQEAQLKTLETPGAKAFLEKMDATQDQLEKVKTEMADNFFEGHKCSSTYLDLLDHHPDGDWEGDDAEEDGKEGEEGSAAAVLAALISYLAGRGTIAPLRIHLVLVDKGVPRRGRARRLVARVVLNLWRGQIGGS